MFDVVVVGSLNLDLVASADRLPGPGETVSGLDFHEYAGGKGLNQAVAAARAGASVAMVGAVGDDDAGRRLRALVVDEGIDDSAIVTVEGAVTGRALITVDADAENSIVVIPGANATVRVVGSDLPESRVVLAQLEVPVHAVLEAFRAGRDRGSVTVLNPAPARSDLDELLAWCDVVVPNEHEVGLLGGPAALLAAGVGDVVVTRGGEGVEHVGSGSGSTTYPAFEVRPVDTTGAGDAFCGALATRLADGGLDEAALVFASAAGALATTKPGAVPSLPRRADIDALEAGRPH